MKLQFILLFFLPFCALSHMTPITTVCLNDHTCYQGGWWNQGSIGFASYQGIRYALPPIGDLRFKAPLPYIPEEGTIDVSEMSSIMCPQEGQTKLGENFQYSGQEDCLMLNVYVPANCFNCSIMVWIHGGGFISGSYGFDQYAQ